MIVDLNGKIGLIIGVANENSIAYGCAKKFFEAGATLGITHLNEKARPYVEPLAYELQAQLLGPCDVSRQEQLNNIFETIKQRFGHLDFILHSIAFAALKDLNSRVVDCSKEGFLESMAISCYSLIEVCRLAKPLMKRGGSILTVSYYGASKVIPNYNLMGVVKAALESATRYLAYDLGQYNIRVNAISTSPIKTRAASAITHFDEYLEKAKQISPLQRLIDVQSVGNLAAFLASSAAQDITGQTYYIDAGCSIMG